MIKVTSFYKFFPLQKKDLSTYKKTLYLLGRELGLRGLILIGGEGINATVCGKSDNVETYKQILSRMFDKKFFWKDSECEKWSFRILSVKIKKEIINTGRKKYLPLTDNQYLSPEKWEKKLRENPQILDIRNSYEVGLGKFKNARNLNIDTFKEFPEKLKNFNIDKNKEVLIYCTGGIRCEKALEIMRDQGFKDIFQLKGGILNYLKKYPRSAFERECFVFDQRVALDQNLQASKKYSLCPHCGQPADRPCLCRHCEKPFRVCKGCQDKAPHYETCSKNCAYHFKAGHICRKKHKKTAQPAFANLGY